MCFQFRINSDMHKDMAFSTKRIWASAMGRQPPKSDRAVTVEYNRRLSANSGHTKCNVGVQLGSSRHRHIAAAISLDHDHRYDA